MKIKPRIILIALLTLSAVTSLSVLWCVWFLIDLLMEYLK